ncbi:cytochrome b [Rhizobium herbae]
MQENDRYDRGTIVLHWLTAAITLFMFVSPYIWKTFERRTPPRLEIQFYHFSIGLLFGIIILGRIFWRANYGKKLPPPEGARNYRIAEAMHHLLYALLVIQISLGIWTRFAQNNPLVFFGLFQVATPYDGAWEHRQYLAYAHYLVAWTTVGLACVHGVVALFHHYVLKDNLLSRLSLGGSRGKTAYRLPNRGGEQ